MCGEQELLRSLLELNERFGHPAPPRRPLPPMKIELLPDELESEDVLDMVNVGLVRIAVCEEWLATVMRHMRQDGISREAREGRI
jgi:hypothetical protein